MSAELTEDTGGVGAAKESSLSNWVGPYVSDMLGKGWALSDMDYAAYDGPLTAGAAPLQDQAFQGIAGLTLSDPTMSAAAGYESFDPASAGMGNEISDMAGQFEGLGYDGTNFDFNRWNNEFASQYMNPYVEQALTPMLDEQRRQAEITRLNDASRLTKAGAFGGSRQAIMESELNDNTARLMSEILGRGYKDAYDTGLGAFQNDEGRRLDTMKSQAADNQFGARYGLDTLKGALDARSTGADVNNRADALTLDALRGQSSLGTNMTRDEMAILSQMLDAGGIDRDILQQGMDADRGQFEEERDYPYRQTQFMQSLLQGLPLATQTTSYEQPSLFQTLLSGTGGAGELVGILQGLGGILGGGGSSVEDQIQGQIDGNII
jgi:hypothetical protein